MEAGAGRLGVGQSAQCWQSTRCRCLLCPAPDVLQDETAAARPSRQVGALGLWDVDALQRAQQLGVLGCGEGTHQSGVGRVRTRG